MKNNLLTTIAAWLRSGSRAVWLAYAGLSLLVILPLLLPGYVLTLDLVFTPGYPWPGQLTNTYPFDVLLWLLHQILPGDVVEKLVLFAILLFSGAGMHQLVSAFGRPRSIAHKSWRLAPYVAGIFYMINPFTYSRFMAGQWLFLLGYALLPFFVRSFIQLVAKPSSKQGIRAGGWAVLIVTVSIHHIAIVGVVGITLIAGGIWNFRRDFPRIKSVITSALVSFLTFALVSSYWLIPALSGTSPLSRSAASFDGSHFAAFATDGGIPYVLRLQGFWVEAQGLFALPQSVTPLWGLVFLLFWLVIIVGGVATCRHARLAASLAIPSIIAGVILAGTPLIARASSLLPLLGGYREPHKFANLVALGFSLLFAFGAARLVTKTRRELSAKAMGVGMMVLPLIITPTMLWGFAGQLSPRHYPAEWYAMDTKLQRQEQGGKVLFLPWHQYAAYSFSGRIIANPAEKFFSVPMIISDDPEFGHISPTSPNITTRKISSLLDTPPDDISLHLQRLGVSHILLAHEQDVETYAWLDDLPGITRIHTDEKLTLYRLEDGRG